MADSVKKMDMGNVQLYATAGRGNVHIDIENDPYLEYNGEDQQLNKAIQVILEKLKTEKKEIPSIPAFPNKAAKKK